jgi:glycosyltransferase involved in cell wall biosynthesis
LPLKSVCLIAHEMEERNWQLQPWRYLTELVFQLSELGHSVTVVSDGKDPLPMKILQGRTRVCRIPSIRNPIWHPNHELLETLSRVKPELIVWHLGLTSFLYQSLPANLNAQLVGFFSNPVYHPRELTRLGFRKVVRNFKYLRVHLAGSLIPERLLRDYELENKVRSLVVQTQTTRAALEQAGFGSVPIKVIPPGIDGCWSDINQQQVAAVRSSWGFSQDDLVLIYYGSLVELRGLQTLLQALVKVRHVFTNTRLVVLSRRRPDEWVQEDRSLMKLLHDHLLEPHVKVISGFLEPTTLVNCVAAADVVVLPFEVLPTDAPLSILEAKTLGKPIVTTRIACLPELIPAEGGYLAVPGDPDSLSEMIQKALARHIGQSGMSAANPKIQAARSWQEMGGEWSNFLQSL